MPALKLLAMGRHLLCMIASLTLPLQAGSLELSYRVDLTRLDADSFFVMLQVRGIQTDSAVFQFPTTAPGTYSVLDPGRFVGGFRALDGQGRELPTRRTTTNQYVIHHARSLKKVTYQVDDTFGAETDSNPVHPMSGTNLERDNAVVNGQMVFGYFKGHQSNPIDVAFQIPDGWTTATALENRHGLYHADHYDHLADSPFMFGKLSQANLKVGGARIDVFCYSENQLISAKGLVSPLNGMLKAANTFLDGLPVRRYTFLFHFRQNTGPIYGAWEHNYSSFYVIPEGDYETVVPIVTSISAHEFFHVVTPLNLHSDVIEKFDFENPKASRHLWLYEGTTEWASDIMQVRAGLMSDRQYMEMISQKLRRAGTYDPRVSLVDLSLGSYDTQESQYQNIYEKGALVSVLLDMRLLELSRGQKGLRDVIRELSRLYGPKRAFPEEKFFDIFVDMTYPEIRDFFRDYVQGTEPLPIQTYLSKAGYDYIESEATGQFLTSLGRYDFGFTDGELSVKNVDPQDTIIQRLGLRDGDILLKLVFNDRQIDLLNPSISSTISAMQRGDRFGWVVRRDGVEITLFGFVGGEPIVDRHVIRPKASVTDEQKQFRKWWLNP